MAELIADPEQDRQHPQLDQYSPLPLLVREARRLEEAIRNYERSTLRASLDLGDVLSWARAQVPPRKWRKYRTEHFREISKRRDEVCRQLACCRPIIERALEADPDLSIRDALKLITKPKAKQPPKPGDSPKRPKKVSEIETPAILGAFLDGHRDLFWQALQRAPELKGEIAQRLFPETANTTVETSKSTSEAAAQVRAIRELLRHPTSTNIETARDKATRTARLLDPAPASKSVRPSRAQLDRGAFNKAIGLDRSDLDIPEFLQRAVPADQLKPGAASST
jgi:hypothetical protein